MKNRVLSSAVMVLIFVPLLLIGGVPFTIFMAVLSLLGVYELTKIQDKDDSVPLLIKVFTYVMVAFIVFYNMNNIDFNYTIDYKFITILISLFVIPIVFINDNKTYNISDALYLISITLFLGFSFNVIALIRNYDLMYLIYLLLISTMTDVFAYISGKLIGKNKLCPKISPNKTIEVAVVGTFMGVFIASSFYHIFINHSYSLVMLILITTCLSIVGQIGDLVFSMIKRYYKTKDFSNIIPGHGGILDRLDSLIFISLAFILIMEII